MPVNLYTYKDQALAVFFLSVKPSLLHVLKDPNDPIVAWNNLPGQFQKKTWANKLQLQKGFYALTLKDGGLVQEHIKKLAESFEELAVFGTVDP